MKPTQHPSFGPYRREDVAALMNASMWQTKDARAKKARRK